LREDSGGKYQNREKTFKNNTVFHLNRLFVIINEKLRVKSEKFKSCMYLNNNKLILRHSLTLLF